MLWLCIWSLFFCSSIEWGSRNAWMAWMVVVRGIYSPNYYSSRCYRRAHRTVRWCTEHNTVHCPVRVTSADRWGLELLTIEVLCLLVAPDSPVTHRIVRCDLTSHTVFWLLTVKLFHNWPLAKLTIAALAHWTVQWILVEWLWENPRATSSRRFSAWAPYSVRCATGCTKSCMLQTLQKSLKYFLLYVNVNFMHLIKTFTRQTS
jgi:hypothetical protein